MWASVAILTASVMFGAHVSGQYKLSPGVVSVLSVLAAVGVGAYLFFNLVVLILGSQYSRIIKDNGADIDTYVNDPSPSLRSRAKVVFIHYFINVGTHVASKAALPLETAPSPFFKGLQVTSKLGTVPSASPFVATRGKNGTLIVGTIRMGFGHHRIAYAAASWGVASGMSTHFHDLLNIDSPEATLIKEMDKGYSKASRMATEMGGAVEALWGSLTRGADENMLRASYQFGEHLLPLLRDIPRDTPIISTHCFVGLMAVALGFKHVINLVIDNHAQWFIVVPYAHNLVQGPSNYHSLLRMGVPADQLRLAGHWIPKDLVDNIDADCKTRIKRATARAPTRILIPVGGAGAQKTFVSNFLRALKEDVAAGTVQLFLNAGDHEHMRVAFVEALTAMGVAKYDTVDTMEGVHAFADRLRSGAQPSTTVTLFAFPVYFPAVATTDVLSRVADVLACKPSELAFYPVPKMMIRRVGDHEEYSARRASEVGDGTLELREVDDALAYIATMKRTPDLLVSMNKAIMLNKANGVYDGCKNAVQLAQQLASSK